MNHEETLGHAKEITATFKSEKTPIRACSTNESTLYAQAVCPRAAYRTTCQLNHYFVNKAFAIKGLPLDCFHPPAEEMRLHASFEVHFLR